MSVERNIDSNIKTALVNNDDFAYAHLVKFERPFKLIDGKAPTDANRYAYYTDGATDIEFDDGSKASDGSANNSQVYKANRILAIGQYSETTRARATSMSLTLAAEDLGATVQIAGTLSTTGLFTPTSTVHNGEILDFALEGFKEGDLIKFTNGSTISKYIIKNFTTNNTVIQTERIGLNADEYESSFPGSNTTATFLIEQDSIELNAPMMERGVTASSTANASPNFVNREVFIHKILINPDTGVRIGTSVIIFKGIIASVNIDENPTSVKVKWNLTSHWGDFEEINGRMTTDEIHRSLTSAGNPDLDSTLRPEYASDLGFMHAETSLSAIATYKTQETRYKMKTKKRGGFAGFFGGKKQEQIEYQIDIQNEVDLNVFLQGKYLPVVYGVQRINGNPIFADTLNDNNKIIYTANTICEGEIHGLFNIYIDDVPLICTDDNDFDVRSPGGSDADNTQLQCHGKMSRGQTISGQVYDSSATQVSSAQEAANVTAQEAREVAPQSNQADAMSIIKLVPDNYSAYGSKPSIAAGDAKGLEHGAHYGIMHPYSIDQMFMHGRPNQKAAAMLVEQAESGGAVGSISVLHGGTSNYSGIPTITISSPSSGVTATAVAEMGSTNTNDANRIRSVRITEKGSGYTSAPTVIVNQSKGARLSANLGGYKRQTDYWTGTLPYWSSQHRLLDTAYSAMKFEIDADATTIPEIEYVVKGKVLDCFNYDNSYIPDALLGADDSSADFTESDLVVVETSVDGTNWVVDSTGINAGNKFKIMHKSVFTTSRGTAHFRYRLDTTPNLGLVNGRATDKTRLRLKKTISGTAKYWHMLTWDHEIVGSTVFPNDWVSAGSNISVNGSGAITISGISAANKAKIGPSNPTIQFYADEWYTGAFATTVSTLKYAILKGTWSGSGDANVLTFTGTNWTGVTFPNTIKIRNAIEFNMTSVSAVANISNSSALTNSFTDAFNNTVFERGAILNNLTTGESREIVAFGTGNNLVEVNTPFLTPAYSDHKFSINGSGADRRASSNPALQTLDYIMNKRFGRGLEEADLDISSFVTSAKLCDSRSDITIQLANSPSGVAVGDLFQITSDGAASGTHVASGVVAAGGIDVTNKTVTLTKVINKFAKKYSTYTSINTGDIVYTDAGNFYRATGSIALPPSTVPTHTSSTTASLTALSGDVQIHKVSGSGSVSVLNMAKQTIPIDYSLYDADWVKYWRYYGWNHHHQNEVTRHQTNFILDTGKSIFSNVNSLLSHFNGILSYENGKYVLSVETQETAPTASYTDGVNTNPYYIDKSDIIGKISVVDNSQKNAKNTIKASLQDPQLNWGTRSVTFFNSDFLKADRNVPKTASFPFTGITNYYNARINTEKELFQTRFSKEISFELGPKAMLLRAGQVLSINYESFGWSNKLFRIENLNFKANCNVSVKCREYDDSIYEITKQQAMKISQETSGQYALKRPSKPTITSVSTNKIGSMLLSWTNADDFIEGSDSTEIWTHTSDSLADAVLLATVDNSSTYMYNAAVAQTIYFWIRHSRFSRGSTGNNQFTVKSDYNASAGTQGTSLAIAAGAQTVKLLPSTHVIDYSVVGAETTTVSFTTVPFNVSGTVFYEFIVGSTSKQNTTGTTFTLADSDEPAPSEAPVRVTVKLRQGANNGTIIAQDTVSIFAVQDGQSAVTGFLTNESHTVATDTSGDGASFSGAGGTFKVFYGNQDITGNAKVTFSAATGTNLSGSINASSGVYTLSNLTADLGNVVFSSLIKGSVIGGVDGTNDITISKTYSISKAKAGQNGTGSAGASSKTVSLTASDYSIVYDKDGATPNPSASTDITLTATAQNFTNPFFKFTGDGITNETSYTDGASSTNDTFTFQVPTSHFADVKSLRVGVSEGEAATTELAFDTISIFAVKPGATGTEGDDGYTIICSNEAHTFPAASNGAISSFSNSGTDFEVFSGGTQLTGITSGTPGNGQFTVSAAVTGITAGAQSASSNKIVFANHSGMSNATSVASIVYTVNVENTTSVTKKQTFTKSTAGATGIPGTANAVVYAYLRKAGDAPTTNPGAVTVSLTGTTSGTITTGSLANSWQKTIPSGDNPLYVVAATASGTGSTDSIAANEWTSAVVLSKDGTDGVTGTNTAIVVLYQRTSSNNAPSSTPDGNTTYTFNTGAVSLTTANGWSTANPGVNSSNPYLWITQATAIASASASTDTIPDSEWAAIKLFSTFAADGAPGNKTALVYAYKRSSSDLSGINVASAGPGTVTVSLSTGLITTSSLANSWSKTPVASDGNPLYICAASAVGTGSTDSIAAAEWSAPSKLVEDGETGSTGNSVVVLYIYKQSSYTAGIPSISGNSNYNFNTASLTSIPTGWSATNPGASSDRSLATYRSEKVLVGTGTSNSVAWPTAEIYFESFDWTPSIFKRSASAPSTPSTASDNPPSGWSSSIPTGSDPVWQSTGTLSNYYSSTYSWSAPIKITGDSGGDGLNNATIVLYKTSTSDSRPDHPNSVLTWNFANKAFTNASSELDGWSVNAIPASDNTYLWTCSATASASTATDTIAVSEWSTETKIGSPKPVRSHSGTIYYDASTTSVQSAPTTSGVSINFDSLVLSGLASGWSTTRATPAYTILDFTITEATYGGSQTISFGNPKLVGDILDKGITDWIIDWDDGNNRLQLKVDGAVTANANYPNSIKNNQISLSGLGGAASNSIPTFTSGSAVPTNGSQPNGSTYRRTTTPNRLYTSNGSTWTELTINTNTEYSAGDFNITNLAGYTAGSYLNSNVSVPSVGDFNITQLDGYTDALFKNSSVVVPTASSGSTLPTASGLVPGETFARADGVLYIATASDTWVEAANTTGNDNTVTQIRQDNTGTYRTGSINLVSGSNMSITETSAGVFNFAATNTNTQLSDAQVRSKISGTGVISYNSSTGVISSSATNISNTNQLTNGAGYTTYTSNQATNNSSNVHFEGLMVGQTSGSTANTIKCVGDVVAFSSSDKRLKDNLTPISNSLEKVGKLTGYEFDWNDKQSVHTGHDIGVVAQEVEEVAPELVETRKHDGFKAVKYEKLVPLLINAINELKAEVEELKSGNRE